MHPLPPTDKAHADTCACKECEAFEGYAVSITGIRGRVRQMKDHAGAWWALIEWPTEPGWTADDVLWWHRFDGEVSDDGDLMLSRGVA